MAEKQKLFFNGQSFAVKGRLCQAIVKYYVERNPEVTLKDLQKVFNTEKNMIVVSYDTAMAITDSSGKKGGDYYTKEADIIIVKDGKVVVWNYWPERFFVPFLEQTKALGYVVAEQDGGVIIMDNAEKETKSKAEEERDTICEKSKNEEGKLEDPRVDAVQGRTNEYDPLQMNETTKGINADGLYDDQIERLIESALADGVLTDKEKTILLKKAQSKGIDPDEFEMVLEARLYKMNSDSKTVQTDEVADKSSIDYERVKEMADSYFNHYIHIVYNKDIFESEWGERKLKSGKVVKTKQLKEVKKTVRDWDRMIRDRGNYLSVMAPKTKEEMLAVIVFLSKFMPVADTSEVDSLFFTMLIKYHDVVTESKRLYSSDSSFMELLNTVSAPFSHAQKIVERSVLQQKKQLKSIKRKLFSAKLKLFLAIAVMVLIIAAPWLLPICGGKSIWWPIVIDVVLLVLGWLSYEVFGIVYHLLDDGERIKLKRKISAKKEEIESVERASSLFHDILN